MRVAVDHRVSAPPPHEEVFPADIVEALDRGRCLVPFEWLGLHERNGNWWIALVAHGAGSVEILVKGSEAPVPARRLAEGVFAARLAAKPADYRLRLRWPQGIETTADPYRFGPLLSEETLQAFQRGQLHKLAGVLGAQRCEVGDVAGVHFSVWAPNARRVSVVGDFNRWDGRRHVMRQHADAGIWEIFIPYVEAGAAYKFELLGQHGQLLPLKADPCAKQTECPPASASVVASPLWHAWHDGSWLARRRTLPFETAPLSIYEVHAPSWQRDDEGGRLDWDALAKRLIPYVQDQNFTHIEFLPVNEYPFGGSWGYQPTAMYAPTARLGSPDAFARFVDSCHVAGIGVIVDWVSAHFPADEHGLRAFDGTPLYEHGDPREGYHQDWHTLIYNYGRTEVRQYLIGSALAWIDRFHVDGLRVDAVASMLYRDYSRAEGEWIPNEHGGRENLEAVTFLRDLNKLISEEHPGVLVMAEESTAWPGVTEKPERGGLGFAFKWNMGWMHDALGYIGRDPLFRRYHHDELTFSLVYAWSEKFVLPLSHDEVVHGKGSLISRMPGDRWQKFANLRAFYGFTWGHPGKKLLFMGSEFAQWNEWHHDRALDWHLLEDPLHVGVQRLISDLNRLLYHEPALHRCDHQPEGFSWAVADDTHSSVFAFLRYGGEGAAPLLVVCNFTPQVRKDYRIGVPEAGPWRELCNTDSSYYGGSNVGNGGEVCTEQIPCRGHRHSLNLCLPPLATLILRAEGNH
ncbi:1,4-alpha-glucan branching protein GlgB [Dyella mobilis]|uniref:1,4-alpha-glucan branching enzyme GlgB n=1 Tax=Dyella mobilis TaxID=1849582 RepID=A0ABS2KDD4_9GAMM|nr:1,4-alpha-glucan branching protein GlgB [Dyella mobilis]MBM7128845.1 1,4-alpha-glucan branching protein GlgB [Dyella mobilis]GLQ99176.1 1,4-alpha-glucan branching enzyme GlgB 1 [Dyella mobilis]